MRLFVCACLAGLWLALLPTARAQQSVVGAAVPCTGGTAAGYACRNVDLLSHLPISSLGGASGVRVSEIWGWTDAETGREYALVGMSTGTAFVDVTDPVNPVYVGRLPLHAGANPSSWRELKVYADHVFIVADVAGPHGMQVFDLRQLRTVTGPPATFQETAHYAGFGTAHNIAVDEETGYAFAVGIRGTQIGACGPGLHIIDVREPSDPKYAGCFADRRTGRALDGYVHDTRCLIYRGPDADHQGREICVSSNETALNIVDVTDKAAPFAISIVSYPDPGYVHQGWFTDDQRYFIVDDELDETGGTTARTRTILCDLEDLDDPVCDRFYFGTTTSIDHNQFVKGHLVFQANYTSGLRILDIRDINNPREVGFFDTYPADDAASFNGAWGNYPYFPSGNVVVGGIREGLFVLRPSDDLVAAGAEGPGGVPAAFSLGAAYPNPFNPEATVPLTLEAPQPVRVVVYDALGREVAVLFDGALPAGTHHFAFDASGLPGGVYLVRASGPHAAASRPVTLLK